MLSYDTARQKVVEIAGKDAGKLKTEKLALGRALGRVLAGDIKADLDYPPFHRSTRDGFAVRAFDITGASRALRLIGESKAGTAFRGRVGAGECVQIMTGAPLPAGADAVVMIEYTSRTGDEIASERAVHPGENVVVSGSEAQRGQVVLESGVRLGYAELAMAGQVGQTRLAVYRRPRVAILSTGDEIVSVGRKPGPFQIRNSNSVSLAAQAQLVGARPVFLGNAPDRVGGLRARILRGLKEDILVLSGGVSAGKYDLVEGVLRDLGAKFHFDAVAIRPGRPTVFCECRGKLVFALPGNPISTMVTFELLVVPAIDSHSGLAPRPLPLFKARLAKPVAQRAALTHFLPALVKWEQGDPVVEELPWQGSGDIVAVARANCFLVVGPAKLNLAAGEWVDVLPRRGTL